MDIVRNIEVASGKNERNLLFARPENVFLVKKCVFSKILKAVLSLYCSPYCGYLSKVRITFFFLKNLKNVAKQQKTIFFFKSLKSKQKIR